MSDGPNWWEVRRATEQLLTSQLILLLNRLYGIGLTGVVVLARLPEPSEAARSVPFYAYVGGATDATEEERVILLAAAAAHNPEVQSLMMRFEATYSRHLLETLPALDFSSASAHFEEVAGRLLSPENDGPQDSGMEVARG